MFLYCFSLVWEASHGDFHDISWYGERLHNEDQYVCGYCRDGQSYCYQEQR